MDSLSLLSKLVSIHSVFPDEKEIAFFLAKELEARGFKVTLQKFGTERYNVLAERGTRGKAIMFQGHIDTVPAYNYEKVDPYKLTEVDGKLYGLGGYDMKAGIAAILKAVEVKTDRKIKVAFVSDEENDSQGCFEFCKSGFLKDTEFVLVTEISDVHDMHEATRTVTMGRRGRVQFRIDVPGKSYHAARQELGISAITQSAHLALAVDEQNKELPKHPKLQHGSQFVRKIFSHAVSLSVPDECQMLIDRHLVVPETIESAQKQIQARIDELYSKGTVKKGAHDAQAKVVVQPREVPYLMPYTTPEDNSNVQMLGKLIKEKLGKPIAFNYGLSVADENLIAMQGVPVVSYGPIGDGEHSNKEWVSKKSYLELIDVLTEFVKNI